MKATEGQFDVIDSFAIRARNESYLIGLIRTGTVKEGWFLNIPLNGSLALTVRVSRIEEIEIAGEKGKIYTLLVVQGDDSDLILDLNVGNETLAVTIDGMD
ncbi:hypothetical protein [Dawidia soli]|uniref:Uncharacterized protein n=1 Tax=Dawidia soli TaxID=2782352 RepID=A0AAP2DAS5_9BACT|nr:hypothetical protein [Dawidia soli]MBT1688578.1 hypothetical protein [Dawidia soli]